MKKNEFIIKGFRGGVTLKEWISHPETGLSFNNIIGTISIYEDKDVVGFEVGKSESNWAAHIEGETSAIWVLGCQIRAIWADPNIKANNVNSYEVR